MLDMQEFVVGREWAGRRAAGRNGQRATKGSLQQGDQEVEPRRRPARGWRGGRNHAVRRRRAGGGQIRAAAARSGVPQSRGRL